MDAIADAKNTLYRKKKVKAINRKIFPCCCPSNQESYFKGFSIFQFIILIYHICLYSYRVYNEFNWYFLLNLTQWIFQIILLSIGFYIYKKDGNYGNNWSFVYSIFTMMVSGIYTVISISVLTWMIILGTDESSIDINLGAAYIVGWIIALSLLMGYFLYLSVIYFFVVVAKRENVEEEGLQDGGDFEAGSVTKNTSEFEKESQASSELK